MDIYQWAKSNNLITNNDFENQADINSAYDSLIETSYPELNANYINEVPENNSNRANKIKIKSFLYFNLNTDRLQQKNILLTSALQYKLLTCKKRIMSIGLYNRSIDTTKKVCNYSYLLKGIINQNEKDVVVYFVNTIQFNYKNAKSTYIHSLTKQQVVNFEKLFYSNEPARINEILFLADKVDNFSIHQYFLPYGLESNTITDAVLLYRCDHTDAKHINYNSSNNNTAPVSYTALYPPYVEYPHFHFTTSFGSIYKLKSNQQSNNFGVGYAIDALQLKEYLIHLLNKDVPLYDDFDFGMPFKSLIDTKEIPCIIRIKKLIRTLDKLNNAIKKQNISAEFKLALLITHLSTNDTSPDIVEIFRLSDYKDNTL